MRDDPADTVTPGGEPAPLGARGATVSATAVPGARRAAGSPDADGRGAPTPLVRLGGRTAHLAIALVAALVVYAALAADVVHGGRMTELDYDVSNWIAGAMPTLAEWVAVLLTWIGGVVGVTVIVVATCFWLLTRRDRGAAILLVAVALGVQFLVFTAKNGYERPRPDAGSPIELPSSYSFPSGHAATGVAVFGLLGLLAAARAPVARGWALIVAGYSLGAAIGLSRVVLNVHYLSDVLAGGCLGLAWLATFLLAVRLARR